MGASLGAARRYEGTRNAAGVPVLYVSNRTGPDPSRSIPNPGSVPRPPGNVEGAAGGRRDASGDSRPARTTASTDRPHVLRLKKLNGITTDSPGGIPPAGFDPQPPRGAAYGRAVGNLVYALSFRPRDVAGSIRPARDPDAHEEPRPIDRPRSSLRRIRAADVTLLLDGAHDDGLDDVALLEPRHPGIASLTVATMMSPMPAYRREERRARGCTGSPWRRCYRRPGAWTPAESRQSQPLRCALAGGFSACKHWIAVLCLHRPTTPGGWSALHLGVYWARSRTDTSRHRLVADSGRVSASRTRSPMPAVPFSSCALTLVVRRMTWSSAGASPGPPARPRSSCPSCPRRPCPRGSCARRASSLMF